MLSHSAAHSTGVLWLNAAETMVDVEDGDAGRQTHWFSESGIIDVFLLSSTEPAEVQQQYAQLVGTQVWSFGFVYVNVCVRE